MALGRSAVDPAQVPSKYILRTLVPLESDERNDGKMRFSHCHKRVVQRIGFSARGRLGCPFAMLELYAREGVLRRHVRRIETLDRVPCSGHANNANIGLAQSALDATSLLQGRVRLVDATRGY